MQNPKLHIGLVGWRGMVGSILLERMKEEGDFKNLSPTFFSTSQAGEPAPEVGQGPSVLKDASDISALMKLDVIVSCQGGDYTEEMYPKLREAGFDGYWVDAASTLRMTDDAIIILDPVNRDVIEKALQNGTKTFVGSNCTVALMLMATNGLFREGLIEWITCMTYQSVTGAGATHLRELLLQTRFLSEETSHALDTPNASPVTLVDRVTSAQRSEKLPTDSFGAPLAASLLPWIDKAVPAGQSREEWKGMVETNKILGTKTPIPIDSICVRVPVLRCHSQALTIKLSRDVRIEEIEEIIGSGNDWVRVVKNTKEETLSKLTPAAVTGKLEVPIGRLRKLNLGERYLGAFTVGDQLLWGAAEPLRRMVKIIQQFAN